MEEHSIDRFQDACGATGPLRLEIGDRDQVGGGVRKRICPQPFALIGRNAGTDLILDHPEVSRRHAYLQVVAGRVFCIDLGSRSGIFWDDQLGRSGWVASGRAITIGPYRVSYEVGRPGAPGDPAKPGDLPDPLASPTLGGDALPEVVLKFPRRPNKPSRLPLDRVLALVGRSPDCRFRLKDASVSAFHCSLLRTPMGVWVIDLLGRGGIRVNGADVRWARLNDGDELGVGDYRILLQCDAPPARPASPDRSSGAGVSTVQSATDPTLRPVGRVGLPRPGPGRFAMPALLGPPDGPPATARLIPGGAPGQLPEGWAPGRAEAIDPLLVHLVSQFSSMQQQMFDQYNQSMMMMSQMFGALQRDQMGLVREELERLQQLTTELQVLQVEAAKQPTSLQFPSPVAPSRPTPGPSPDPASRGIEAVRNGATAPEPRTPPAESGIPPSGLADRPAPGRPTAQGHDDVHAWLNQRIATIQEERQGLWQKILGLVMGQPNSGVLP